MNKSFIFTIVLLSFIPLVFFPNTGQDALLIPFNIFLWEVCALSIFFASVRIYQNSNFVYPRYFFGLLLLPTGLILSNLIIGFPYPTDSIFRCLAIFLGLFFFISLFQFQANRRTIDNAIYILLTGVLLNSIVSFLQMLPGRILIDIIPHPFRAHPAGVFMQPNILASSMATAIVLAFYQISSPGFNKRNSFIKALTFTTIFSSTFILFSTGSRIGIIGIVIALPILLLSRIKIFKLKKSYFSVSIITFIIAFSCSFLFSNGTLKAYSKIEKLASEGIEARSHIYLISWKLFTDAPFFGHGIGSFKASFHQNAAQYLDEKGGAPLIGSQRFSHPHNEILLWAVEGGVLALIGLASAVVAALFQARRIGWQRGGAMLAMMLPITLHTQTELPFYSSIYHWLVFLFLAFMLFEPLSSSKSLKSINKFIPFIPATGFIFLLSVLFFCSNTLKVSRDLNDLLFYGEVNEKALKEAENNIYFKRMAEESLNRVNLINAVRSGTKEGAFQYINWAESNIHYAPSPRMFHDLSLAYAHLGQINGAVYTIERGYYLYPEHTLIQSAEKQIFKNLQSELERFADTILRPTSTLATSNSSPSLSLLRETHPN